MIHQKKIVIKNRDLVVIYDDKERIVVHESKMSQNGNERMFWINNQIGHIVSDLFDKKCAKCIWSME